MKTASRIGRKKWTSAVFLAALFIFSGFFFLSRSEANDKVYITRFWHNHQPLYWPEWNSNGDQTQRAQYAWDSIVLKDSQNYGGISSANHPENNLTDIFGIDDRKAAYQGRPSSALSKIGQAGGFGMSYSGSLIDNVRQLGGGGHLGYGGDWNSGNTAARSWKTPAGSSRLDLLGFTYHHSLAPLLPKEVFRKEMQIFKQAWWKAWGGSGDLSDHTKGFFPTEMAYTRELIDVLVDEGYEWLIVASHHISRTSPSYNNYANPEGEYNIFSSPPNKADQLGPTFDNGWWFDQPNPGQAAWNVAPYAYQLHKVKYVNPETGAEKTMVAVPSDDVLSYQAGYSGAQIGRVDTSIAPFATDANRPVVVMPSTDGDNAWGGGYDSWEVATPGFFGAAESRGYKITTMQDFVNQFGQYAPVSHIEDGAWIFPEMCYGSPNFMKWIEPPLYNTAINATNRYPGTQADMETPGYALKFFSYAPLMAGANWCITAEQIMEDEGGSVDAWKIQAPYDWDGSWTAANDVELAWHIYLKGLDSGFNYYGGLGNDDENKPSLATKRAVDKLRSYMSTRMDQDRTGPTTLRPQRFPYNPGAYTFGWFNRIPGGDERFLKKMPSEFYIWTHAYDVSGVTSVNLKIRRDKDGTRSLANNHNETYAGGSDVEDWITIPMTKRTLPNTRSELNTAAANGEIDFFVYDLPGDAIELADYYFAKITDSAIPNFRDNLFDYYIEATDTRGNVSKSEIQHVWVENDGATPSSYVQFSSDPNNCSPLTITYYAENGPLQGYNPVTMHISFDGGTTWSNRQMGGYPDIWTYNVESVPSNAASAIVWFEGADSTVDSNDGSNWSTSIRDCYAPVGPSAAQTVPAQPGDCNPILIRYQPNEGPLQGASQVYIHIGHDDWQDVITNNTAMTPDGYNWEYTYTPDAGIEQINVVFNDGTTWDNHGGLDWNFTVTNCAGPIPDGVTITNPASHIEVANGKSAFTVQGSAKSIADEIRWTNQLTGGTGTILPLTAWAIQDLPLAVGSNLITVSGTSAATTGSETNAADDASKTLYDNGWSAGQNGGTGFGAWQFYRSVEDANQAGWFTRSQILGDRSWAMYANSSQLAEAKRPFNSALQVGQTFHVKMRNGNVDTGAGIGIALQNATGDTLWQFFFNGGDTYYSITDGTTDIGWTDGGLEVAFTLTGESTFSAKILPYGSTEKTYTGNLETHVDQDIAQFRAWNNFAGTGEASDYYINDLRITTPGSASTYSDSISITRAAAGTDTNGDGVPDSWYDQYGYNPALPDVGNEIAANGQTVKDCYILGVDPTDPDAYKVKIDDAVEIAQGHMRLSWYSENGRRYAIDATDDLTQGFTNVLTIITETENRTRSFDDTGANTAQQLYYRLRYIGEE